MSLGSSPHTRGARDSLPSEVGHFGIIPAYAGSTTPSVGGFLQVKDHPRIRGEHGTPTDRTFSLSGSSPHTRGAPTRRPSASLTSGIIPAYAGSTLCIRPFLRDTWDHPRIRGEHYKELVTAQDREGSSPHTRGAQLFTCKPTRCSAATYSLSSTVTRYRVRR